eukprot:4537602-Prymnesium_polylepis.1
MRISYKRRLVGVEGPDRRKRSSAQHEGCRISKRVEREGGMARGGKMEGQRGRGRAGGRT